MTAVWVGGAYLKCSLASLWMMLVCKDQHNKDFVDTEVGEPTGSTRTSATLHNDVQMLLRGTILVKKPVVNPTFSLQQLLSKRLSS